MQVRSDPTHRPADDASHNNRILLSLSCLAVGSALAMAGCKPQEHVAARGSSPAPAQAATMASPAATTVMPSNQQAASTKPAASFDRDAMAGTFAGMLPCADCPGIDETLQLDVDGHFELTDRYRARPDSTNTVRGTWSVEANGAHLRLDPEKQRDVDRVFAIEANDTLAPLGMDGVRIDSPVDLTLKRSNP